VVPEDLYDAKRIGVNDDEHTGSKIFLEFQTLLEIDLVFVLYQGRHRGAYIDKI
jgi:hypothetical protein